MRIEHAAKIRSRRRLGVVVLFVLGFPVLAAGACDTIDPDYVGNIAGARLAFIGDSITHQSATTLHERFDPDFLVRVSAVVGQRYNSMSGYADVIAATDPNIVVLNLGTNEASGIPNAMFPTLTTSEEAIAAMQAMVDRFPNACKVIVTVNEGVIEHEDYRPEIAVALNDAIVAEADVVVDWSAAVSGDQLLYVANGVHPTDPGKELLASLIADGVALCPA